MLADLLKHPKALIFSVLFHVVILGLIVIDLSFTDKQDMMKVGEVAKTIKAEVIESTQLEQEKKQEAQIKKEQEIEKKEALAKLRAQKEMQEAKKKQEAEKKKADKKKADKQKAEKKLKADEKRKQLKRKKEAETKRIAAEKLKADEKRKIEAKKKVEDARVAEEKRKVAEQLKAEQLRVAEEKRKIEQAKLKEQERLRAEAEQLRLAEQERKRKESALKSSLLAEENQRRLDSQREAYKLAIFQKIKRNWIRPPGSDGAPPCVVNVLQGPGGIILDVTFATCNGNTANYRASIEKAVYRAEPLPKPSDPVLFERDLTITFKPE